MTQADREQQGGQHGGHLYTVSQMARIVGIPQSRLRSWTRRGLIHPFSVRNRLCFFDFRQVAHARSLQRLLASGVSMHRIRRGLERLRAWSGGAESIADLQAEAGGGLLVRLRDGALAEPNGQLRLDFASDPVPEPSALRERSGTPWFELGIRAEEEGRLLSALRAYTNELATGGPRAEVYFNLGNTLYALGRKLEAVHRFTQATEADPAYVEAWNNLGNALSDTRPERAIAAYRRALALEPGYADAHYNLAESLAQAGQSAQAREHWRAYLRLAPHDPWCLEP
jgi:tetratricopeptide (TPR) repeat protein